MKDKVIVFMHGIDIDGYGCAVLAKLAYSNPEIVYVGNNELDDLLLERWESGELSGYDKVYVTDHCPSESLCQKIDELPEYKELKAKLKVLDHHKDRIKGDYPFVTLEVENKYGAFCGTELFCKDLLEQGLLKLTPAIDDFVEFTRIYDVEWSNPEFEKADKLNNLALVLGREEYVECMTRKLLNNKMFTLSDEENNLIKRFLEEYNRKLKEYVSKVQVVDVDGVKAGYVVSEQLYKNNIIKELRNLPIANEIKFLMIRFTDSDSVSLRSVDSDFDVSAVAKVYGGGGHPFAAGFKTANLPKELLELEQE